MSESPPVKLPRPLHAAFLGGLPCCLRFSTMCKRMAAAGADQPTLDKLEAMREKAGSSCPIHGELADPIVGMLHSELAFICPDCSDPKVKAQWVAEGEAERGAES